jgi:ribosomal protein L9
LGKRLPATTHDEIYSWFKSIVPEKKEDLSNASEQLNVKDFICKLDAESDMKVFADQMAKEVKEKDKKAGEELDRERAKHKAELD